MTQFGRPTLDPAVDDGITLSSKANGAWNALYTNHAGAAAPPTPEKGQIWIDTSQEGAGTPTHSMKIYTGSVWRTLGVLNLTTGLYSTAGDLSLSGGTMTGQILGQDGAAATPGYAFSGSSNMGMYRIGATTIGWSTNSLERLRLDTNTLTFTGTTTLLQTPSNGNQCNLFMDRTIVSSGWTQIVFRTNTSNRWGIQVSGNEAGANAGSTFNLLMFDDAGTQIVNFLNIRRDTRQMGLNGAVIGSAVQTIRTNAAAAGEDALEVMNTNTDVNGWVGINFRTAGGALRAALRGERPGNNNGDLGVWTGVTGTLTKAATFRASGNLDVVGQVSANGVTLTSSVAVKEDIAEIDWSALPKIDALRVVSFNRKREGSRREVGFIAEEVAKVLPTAVTEEKDSIHLADLIATLTKAVQELSARVRFLESEGKSS